MGMQATLLVNCDQLHELEKIDNLGQRISWAINGFRSINRDNMPGLTVVDVNHMDVTAIALVGGYSYKGISYRDWASGVDDRQTELQLLKDAAEKYGYTLRKKPTKVK